MLSAFLTVAALSACVPARWPTARVDSLDLLRGSPVNCLLVETASWQSDFLAAARQRGLKLLAVVDEASLAQAVALGFDALVVEGAASARVLAAGPPVVELRSRARLDPVQGGALLATSQGLWPGVRAEREGAVHARPSGGPWIETNGGFLRFLRAAAPSATIWIANRPPPGNTFLSQRYIQAVADAAIAGGRWVLDFDPTYWRALLDGDSRARAGFQRIGAVVRFYEQQRALVDLPDYSTLALIEDARSGALVSGGILDMIAAKHIPVRALPGERVASADRVTMLLNINPAGLTAEHSEAVRRAARQGATLVNGPPGWQIPLPPGGGITFADDQVKQIDEMWREINSLVGRRNFGVRVFGAPSMLSNLKAAASGPLALHLVNYSDYAVENITLHVAGRIRSARLLTPQGARPLEVYAIEDESGVDLDRVDDVAIVVLERQP